MVSVFFLLRQFAAQTVDIVKYLIVSGVFKDQSFLFLFRSAEKKLIEKKI